MPQQLPLMESTTKYIPFDENIVKIGSVDHDIIGLQEITKKETY